MSSRQGHRWSKRYVAEMMILLKQQIIIQYVQTKRRTTYTQASLPFDKAMFTNTQLSINKK